MKKWIAVVLLILSANIIAGSFKTGVHAEEIQNMDEDIPEELTDLYAQSAVLMDADSGRILFGKNETNIMPMASTTKIMTCILVLENTDQNSVADVSANAAAQPRVRLGVNEGEQYHTEDLLYSLMLESHNDSAVVLAEHISGSTQEFAALMNEKAEEIGCTDTYFITPNGLDASDENGVHSTTSADLARIMRYCINVSDKKEEFLKITQTKSYSFTNISGERSFSCTNHNAFLDMMDGALSGKTGFTADAGYCYVGALEQNGEAYIVSLLACGWPNNKNYKWSDTKKLMSYGLENYSYRNVWKDVELNDVEVVNGMPPNWENRIEVSLKIDNEPDELCLLVKDDEEIEIVAEIPEVVEAPVEENTIAGEIKCYISSEEIGKWDVIFCQNIDKKSWWKYLVKITKKALIS